MLQSCSAHLGIPRCSYDQSYSLRIRKRYKRQQQTGLNSMMTTMTKQSPWMDSSTVSARLTVKKFSNVGTSVASSKDKLLSSQQEVLQYYKSAEFNAIMSHTPRWSESKPTAMPALQCFSSDLVPIADGSAVHRPVNEGVGRLDRCPLMLGMPGATELLPSSVLSQARPASMKWAATFHANTTLPTNKCFWISSDEAQRDPQVGDKVWLCPRKVHSLGRLFLLRVVEDDSYDGVVVELEIPFRRQPPCIVRCHM